MRQLALAPLVAVLLAVPVWAQTGNSAASDKEAVRQAALDYVEGIYNVQPERIQRSVHPKLVKSGFYRREVGGPYVESPMTFEQLVQLTGSWNKEKKRDTSVKEVVVLDVLDQTATVKLVAAWGIDYMHLAKYDGTWKISQILWQSHPPKMSTTR
jgi:hypothetical protein